MLPLRLPANCPVTSSNISRDDRRGKKARKALSKDVAAELRRRAKGAGWRFTKGGSFGKATDGLSTLGAWLSSGKTIVTVHLKPGYRSNLLGHRSCAAEQKSATFVSDVGSMDDQGSGAK